MQLYNYWRDATIYKYNREVLAKSLTQFRRAIHREFMFNLFQTYSDFEFSLPQLATLLFLSEEEQNEPTIKQIAENLGRSISTVSRLIDQLVERELITRREDPLDRRNKRLAITNEGRALLARIEEQRLEAQLIVMEYLSAEEQAEVVRGMLLLAEASARRRQHENSPAGKAGQQYQPA